MTSFDHILTIRRKIGAGIKSERERQGLSPHKLAIASGVHQTNLNQIERGNTGATIDTLVKLSDALKIDIRISHEDAK